MFWLKFVRANPFQNLTPPPIYNPSKMISSNFFIVIAQNAVIEWK
jgi:hypothetical protein